MITESFLVAKWETLERARRYYCKNLLNLDCQDSFCFVLSSCLKNNLGKVFASQFLQNV